MAQIEFIYNGNIILIHGNYNEKFQDILQKLLLKLEINLNSLYFLYSGKVLTDFELKIDNIIKNIDKENNKMSVQIINIEKAQENNIIIKSPYVICPECKEIAKININDYRVRIYDCINQHEKNNISMEEYEKSQKIDLAEILCDICKIKNKGNSYKKLFYRCNTCKKNLCPICKEKHEESHNIINYDDKNYICEKHNYPFALYCKSCKKNICVLCENEHDNHETVSYGKIIPNKEKIKKNLDNFKDKIDLLKTNIKEIIHKLNIVLDNIEKLNNIYKDIIKNDNFKNYENIQNINDINIEKNIEDLNEINIDIDINNKFEKIMNIYNKIMNLPLKSKNNNFQGIFENNFNNNMNMNYMINSNNNINNNILNNNFNNKMKNISMNNFDNMNLLNNNMNNINNFNNINMKNQNIGMNLYQNNQINCNKNMNMGSNQFKQFLKPTFTSFNNEENMDHENDIFVTFTFKINKRQIYIDI